MDKKIIAILCSKHLLNWPVLYLQVHVHGQNLTTVYDQIDMSMLPEEYLPDDYTGPHAGTVQEIASKAFTLYLIHKHHIWWKSI